MLEKKKSAAAVTTFFLEEPTVSLYFFMMFKQPRVKAMHVKHRGILRISRPYDLNKCTVRTLFWHGGRVRRRG